MKLKFLFESMELDDQIVAVPVGKSAQEFRSIIKLNDSAAEMFSLLKQEITEEEMVVALKKTHGDDPEIRGYVQEFVKYLMSEGVLT